MDLDEFATSRLSGLLRFARLLTGDRALAEDLVQDVIVQLYAKPAVLDGVANPDAYSRRMVINRYASWSRKWRRIRPSADIAEELSRAPGSDVVDLRDELRTRLLQLPPRQRAALVMRYFLDLSDSQIAEEIDCTVSTVHSHISRGLATLRVQQSAAEELIERPGS